MYKELANGSPIVWYYFLQVSYLCKSPCIYVSWWDCLGGNVGNVLNCILEGLCTQTGELQQLKVKSSK